MLVCENCGDRGFTPICGCGGLRVPPDALADPELHGLREERYDDGYPYTDYPLSYDFDEDEMD